MVLGFSVFERATILGFSVFERVFTDTGSNRAFAATRAVLRRQTQKMYVMKT